MAFVLVQLERDLPLEEKFIVINNFNILITNKTKKVGDTVSIAFGDNLNRSQTAVIHHKGTKKSCEEKRLEHLKQLSEGSANNSNQFSQQFSVPGSGTDVTIRSQNSLLEPETQNESQWNVVQSHGGSQNSQAQRPPPAKSNLNSKSTNVGASTSNQNIYQQFLKNKEPVVLSENVIQKSQRSLELGYQHQNRSQSLSSLDDDDEFVQPKARKARRISSSSRSRSRSPTRSRSRSSHMSGRRSRSRSQRDKNRRSVSRSSRRRSRGRSRSRYQNFHRQPSRRSESSQRDSQISNRRSGSSQGQSQIQNRQNFSQGQSQIQNRPNFSQGQSQIQNRPNLSQGQSQIQNRPDFSQQQSQRRNHSRSRSRSSQRGGDNSENNGTYVIQNDQVQDSPLSPGSRDLFSQYDSQPPNVRQRRGAGSLVARIVFLENERVRLEQETTKLTSQNADLLKISRSCEESLRIMRQAFPHISTAAESPTDPTKIRFGKGTEMCKRQYGILDWSNPKETVQKMALAVFGREILLTHTVSGHAPTVRGRVEGEEENPFVAKPALPSDTLKDILSECLIKYKEENQGSLEINLGGKYGTTRLSEPILRQFVIKKTQSLCKSEKFRRRTALARNHENPNED